MPAQKSARACNSVREHGRHAYPGEALPSIHSTQREPSAAWSRVTSGDSEELVATKPRMTSAPGSVFETLTDRAPVGSTTSKLTNVKPPETTTDGLLLASASSETS